MKLGYYNPQLKCRQVKQGGKVVGHMVLTHYAYGYCVTLHYYGKAGYAVKEYRPSQEQAEALFDKIYKEVSENA